MGERGEQSKGRKGGKYIEKDTKEEKVSKDLQSVEGEI